MGVGRDVRPTRFPFARRPLASAALLAVSAVCARPALAETPKLLKPEHYQSRVVAPRKGRVLLVNFWATWCGPCREEMPALAAAAKGFKSRDVAIVLVSLDTKKTAPNVSSFLSANKVPFVTWLAKSPDPQLFIDAVDRSWDGSLPFTLVYGRDGKVTAKLLGAQTEEAFAAALRKAVGAT